VALDVHGKERTFPFPFLFPLFLVLPLPNLCVVENRGLPVIFRLADDIALAETEVDLLSGQIWPICIKVWNS